jgi:hypothetical protein
VKTRDPFWDFYAHENLNCAATTASDLLRWLDNPIAPDPNKSRRFLHCLIHEFYSFGEFSTKPVHMPDGSRMTATTGIFYSRIRGLGKEIENWRAEAPCLIPWESPLFDRYRCWQDTKEKLRALFGLKSAAKNRFPILALLKILDDPDVAPPPIFSKREHGKPKSFWSRKLALPLQQWMLERRLRKKWFPRRKETQ